MTRRFRTSLAATVITAGLLCGATEIYAQLPPAPRAPQGLFGGVRPDAAAKTRLDFTASLVEGYDSDVPMDLRPIIDPTSLQSGGLSTIVNATAAYGRRGNRYQFGANATSALRHYAELGETRSVGHSAGIGLSVRLPGRTSLLVNQATAYSPTQLSGLFPTGAVVEPGSPGAVAPDYSVSDSESYSYTTSATLRHDLDRRSSFSTSGEFLFTDRVRQTAQWQDVSAYGLVGTYARNVGRSVALSSKGEYRSGEYGYGGDGMTKEVKADVGLAYTRQLSATRSASFRFNFGFSRADLPEVVAAGTPARRQYLTVGDGGVDYLFGRTWQARANYRRGLERVVDLPEPVFATGYSVGLNGFVTPRVDVSGSAGYSSGQSLFNPASLLFDTYTGSLRVRFALTRAMATYVEYLYYFYDFTGYTQLLAGIPSGMERNGVRVGFTLWVPALRR